MAYLAVNKNGYEEIFVCKPYREFNDWSDYDEKFEDDYNSRITLSEGTIKKLIGHDLTWDDEPVEI